MDMSKTDKTDPYWVKLLHAKTREETHGPSCTGDNCDIEHSLAPWHRRYDKRSETRTVTRTIWVDNPNHSLDADSFFDRWNVKIEKEISYTYRYTVYDGPRCHYRLPWFEEARAYGRCNCCEPDAEGMGKARAQQRAVLRDLIRRANSGDDVDDYIFEKDSRWGQVW